MNVAGGAFDGLPRFTSPPRPVSHGTHCTDPSKARSARLPAGRRRTVQLRIKPAAVLARCSLVISLRPSHIACVQAVSPLCARTPGSMPLWSGTGILIMMNDLPAVLLAVDGAVGGHASRLDEEAGHQPTAVPDDPREDGVLVVDRGGLVSTSYLGVHGTSLALCFPVRALYGAHGG